MFKNLSRETKAGMFISVYVVFLVLLISPDSFTHDIYSCCDTPIFFMCGKAWMNGMIPYVDFVDSKGPLLWLIQGIGYLISYHTYFGVCLISCVFYYIVFYYVYKTATIFIDDFYSALLCSVLMGLVYFNPWYHYEIKSEDWCQLFIILAVYSLCNVFYKVDTADKKMINKTAYILGLCLTGPLLIKYSITVMMGIFPLMFVFFLYKRQKSLLAPFVFFILGCCTLFLPFVFYFLIVGHFGDFIQEYFIKTFETVKESNTTVTYVHELLLTIADTRYALLFFSATSGCVLFSRKVKHFRYFPLISFFFFWLISIHHVTSYYYLTSNFVFLVFLVIYIVSEIDKAGEKKSKELLRRLTILVVVFLTLWNYTFTDGYLLSNLFFTNNSYRKTYYNAAAVLSLVKNPKIVYLDCAVHGWETPVNGLPGSKYYNSQYGETKEMRERKFCDILQRKADFICMEKAYMYDDALEIVNKAGYFKCYEFNWWHHHFYFYTKYKNLPKPFPEVTVSNLDVFFKRDIFRSK